jgi:hypothetical protein
VRRHHLMGGGVSRELRLSHQPDRTLPAHMNIFIVQLLMNAWTTVTSFVLLINSENSSTPSPGTFLCTRF